MASGSGPPPAMSGLFAIAHISFGKTKFTTSQLRSLLIKDLGTSCNSRQLKANPVLGQRTKGIESSVVYAGIRQEEAFIVSSTTTSDIEVHIEGMRDARTFSSLSSATRRVVKDITHALELAGANSISCKIEFYGTDGKGIGVSCETRTWHSHFSEEWVRKLVGSMFGATVTAVFLAFESQVAMSVFQTWLTAFATLIAYSLLELSIIRKNRPFRFRVDGDI